MSSRLSRLRARRQYFSSIGFLSIVVLWISREFPAAPPLEVARWFNTDTAISLDDLAGQVMAIEAFQMLCPGCVSHGLPQAQRIAGTFAGEVMVLGLHTVFEHHEAMGPVSLEAFLYEYRIGFPVGVDTHDQPGGTPITMARYQLRGTPSLILIDRAGRDPTQRLRPRRRPHGRRRPGPPHRRTTPTDAATPTTGACANQDDIDDHRRHEE